MQPPGSVLPPLALAQQHSGLSDSTEQQQQGQLWLSCGALEASFGNRQNFTSTSFCHTGSGNPPELTVGPLQTDKSCSQGKKLPALSTERRPKGGRQFFNCTQENVLICPLLFRLYFGTLSSNNMGNSIFWLSHCPVGCQLWHSEKCIQSTAGEGGMSAGNHSRGAAGWNSHNSGKKT